METNKKHSAEHKAANIKTITVGGEEKLLLLDDETVDSEEHLSENELAEIVQAVVAETVKELEEPSTLYEGWLDEAEYPEGFAVSQFKALPSFRKRVEYAKQHLGKLGKGSSRIVLAVDPDTVIKIAINKKGQAQNQIEADVSRIGYESIADVKDYDEENFLYVEMERAQKLKKSDWKRLTGWSFNDWMSTLENFMSRHEGRVSRMPVSENHKEIEESDLFSDVVTMLADFDMGFGDIIRTSSWGIVTRNGKEVPVLIDYGLTHSVYDEFYR